MKNANESIHSSHNRFSLCFLLVIQLYMTGNYEKGTILWISCVRKNDTKKAMLYCLKDFAIVFCSFTKSHGKYHLCCKSTSDTIVHAGIIKSQRNSVFMGEIKYQEISQLSSYKARGVLCRDHEPNVKHHMSFIIAVFLKYKSRLLGSWVVSQRIKITEGDTFITMHRLIIWVCSHKMEQIP